MKISLYAWLHIKTIHWKFCNLNPKSSHVIWPWCLNFSCKVAYFLTSIVSVCLWTNISYIWGVYIWKIKQHYNAKPSAYHFYVKTKILLDFHICINVPLSKYLTFFYLTYLFNWSKEHYLKCAIKERRCKFKVGKITKKL